MAHLELHIRVVKRLFLTPTNWLAGQHFLTHKEAQCLKWLSPILKCPSYLSSIHQRSFCTSHVLSCPLKSGLPSAPQPSGHLWGIYLQKHGLRSGSFGFNPRSSRILRKNKEVIQDIIDTHSDTIARLAQLLGCRESKVVWMVSKDTRILTSFAPAKVEAVIKLLLDYGFSSDSIMRYQSVFCWKYSTLQDRVEGLVPYRKYQFSIMHAIAPQNIYDETIEMLQKEVRLMGPHPSRISYLSELLNCKEEDIHQAIDAGHRHLEHYKLTRLKSIVNLLIDHDFSTEEIMDNLHILQMDVSLCHYRLKQMAKTGDFGKEKMLQTLIQNKNQYQVMFDLHRSNVKALGEHDDKFAFLQSRLDCSEEQIQLLLIRAPTIRNITPRRLKLILDILLDEFKFATTTILRNHHLLFFSAKRLRNRWEVLSEFSLHESQLVTDLIMTKVKFEEKYGEYLEKDEK